MLCRRELHPEGILYASKESHYSIFKAARMYRMKCEIVETMATGEINCKDLEKKLLLNKDKPAIINVNIGTNFTLFLQLYDFLFPSFSSKSLTLTSFSRTRALENL